jgi:hypothetical protein
MACCGKIVCSGCYHANDLQSNPFCDKEYCKILEKRADANDAYSVFQLCSLYINGDELGELFGIKKDVDKAVT